MEHHLTPGNTWQGLGTFFSSQTAEVEGATGTEWVETRGAVQYPPMHQTVPTAKTDPTLDLN